MSLLLFLIYIDDVTLSDAAQVLTICYTIGFVLAEDYIMLQNDINTVNNWFKCNYLTLNVSSYLVISHRKQGYCHPPVPLLDDSCLERVESFKYLGILLYSDLSCMVKTY